MRPFARRSSSSGAFFGLAFLVVILMPLALYKFLGEIVAPDMSDAVIQRIQSFAAGLSSAMVGGVKDALMGLLLLAAAIYLSCVLHSVMRSDKTNVRNPKSRRIA